MKRSLSFFRLATIVGILSFVFLSCGEKKAVRKVSQSFLQNYYVDNDFEAAKAVSTEPTHETLDFKAMMFSLNPNSESESINAFKIKKIDVRETKASCFYEVLGQERRLNLRKTDQGVWLVDMPENASIEPGLSLSQSRNQGGFSSATSEPIRLKDVPTASSKSKK